MAVIPDILNAGLDRGVASFHAQIEQQTGDFARSLPDTHQVLACVFLPGGHQIIATWFGYQEPDLLVVDGTDERGRQVRLLAARTDVHIVLTAVKRIADRPAQPVAFQPRTDGPV